MLYFMQVFSFISNLITTTTSNRKYSPLVQYRRDDNEDEYGDSDDVNVTHSEPEIYLRYVVPEEDLLDAIIDDRYKIGELMHVGHIGSIRYGEAKTAYFLLIL